MNANREHKASLFSSLFNDPEKLRILYNAIADTNYDENTPVEINTLDDILFKDQMNDISFIIGGKSVVLIEHQSTVSDNIPLRCLMYIGRLYEKIAKTKAIYREKLLKIPTPEFIVIYNGIKPYPENKTLKLSDSYMKHDETQDKFGYLELTVRVVNVNPGFNEDLKQKSVDLNQYSIFTNRVQENIDKGLLLVNAIKETIRWSIEQGILSSYLTKHESEVENMLYTEWNWDDAKEIWQEEAREDGVIEGLERGRKQGHKEGQIKGLKEGIDKVLSLIKSGLSIEEVEKIISDKQ